MEGAGVGVFESDGDGEGKKSLISMSVATFALIFHIVWLICGNYFSSVYTPSTDYILFRFVK